VAANKLKNLIDSLWAGHGIFRFLMIIAILALMVTLALLTWITLSGYAFASLALLLVLLGMAYWKEYDRRR